MEVTVAVTHKSGEPATRRTQAELVKLADGAPFQFLVWKNPFGTFEVAEASTGRRVADGETRKRASMAAGAVLRTRGMPALYAQVAHWPTLNEQFAADDLGLVPDGPYSNITVERASETKDSD